MHLTRLRQKKKDLEGLIDGKAVAKIHIRKANTH